MIHLNQKLINRIILTCVLVFILVLPVTNNAVNAQTAPNYFVTVNPTTPDSQIYTTVGKNWTLSFEALWSYGDGSGNQIENAKVTIQVNNSRSEVINTLLVNTNTGLFSFNYSSSTADILTFTPIKLVTHDGTEWKSNLLDEENSIYGFQSKSVVIWWDTFHVSLVSYDTETLGEAIVSVNVTYLLLPEEGLTLPEWATYSHQIFLPKIARNASVTINGVKAEETPIESIYKSNLSIWLPTAYIHVEVSQEGWVTTPTGFSFAHNANEHVLAITVIVGLVLVVIALIIFLVLRRKVGSNVLSFKNYPVLGGVVLAIISVISLYWGLVGLDSTLHGFDWILLTIVGLLSFGVGISAALLSFRMKIQPLVIIVIILPMFTNIVGIKYSLDMYGLSNPWLMLIASFVLSVICSYLICNADEEFT